MKKATPSKSARIKKNKWETGEKLWCLISEDAAYQKPFEIFANTITGEVKLFLPGVIKQRGSQAIIDELNKGGE